MIVMDDRFLHETTQDEMWLMLHLARFLKERQNTCWPSNETLIEVTGWSESKFREVRKGCIKKGFLRTESRFRHNGTQTSSIYHFETERLFFIKAMKGMFGISKDNADDEIIDDFGRVVKSTTLTENTTGGGSKNQYPHYIEQTEIHIEPDLNVVCEQTTLVQTKLQKRLNCKNAKHEQAVIEIVDYFNLVTGRKAEYQTAGALKYILHWLNEGHSVEEFKAVIDYKTSAFKGTENEKHIALDTYCRFDKFEDNLSKARNTQPTSADPSLNDCALTTEQAAKYEETKQFIYSHYPNLKDVRFFSHREFLLVQSNDNKEFLPEFWRNKATVRNMQDMKKNTMAKLNTNHFERKAAGSLYDYLKTQIRAELKKD